MRRKIFTILCFFISCGMMTATYSYLGTFQSSTPEEAPKTKSNAKGVFIPPKYPNQTTTTTTTTTTTSSSNVQLSRYYVNKRYNFSIQYPANWQYLEPAPYMASFIGTYGTPSAQSSLTIQSLKNRRGMSVQQIIENGKQTLVRRAGSFTIDDDSATPALPNSPGYQGRYVVLRYTIDNVPMQQIEIIFYKKPNRGLFVVDYIAPESQFAADLPIAKAMIKSITLP